MSKKRKKYTPKQKVQIIKMHLVDRGPCLIYVTNSGCIPRYFTDGKKPFLKMGPKRSIIAYRIDRNGQKILYNSYPVKRSQALLGSQPPTEQGICRGSSPD